jgi:hypothetical protein
MQPFQIKFTTVPQSFQTICPRGGFVLRYICNTHVQTAAPTPFFIAARRSTPGIDVFFKIGLQHRRFASVHQKDA